MVACASSGGGQLTLVGDLKQQERFVRVLFFCFFLHRNRKSSDGDECARKNLMHLMWSYEEKISFRPFDQNSHEERLRRSQLRLEGFYTNGNLEQKKNDPSYRFTLHVTAHEVAYCWHEHVLRLRGHTCPHTSTHIKHMWAQVCFFGLFFFWIGPHWHRQDVGGSHVSECAGRASAGLREWPREVDTVFSQLLVASFFFAPKNKTHSVCSPFTGDSERTENGTKKEED